MEMVIDGDGHFVQFAHQTYTHYNGVIVMKSPLLKSCMLAPLFCLLYQTPATNLSNPKIQ